MQGCKRSANIVDPRRFVRLSGKVPCIIFVRMLGGFDLLIGVATLHSGNEQDRCHPWKPHAVACRRTRIFGTADGGFEACRIMPQHLDSDPDADPLLLLGPSAVGNQWSPCLSPHHPLSRLVLSSLL